MNSTDAFEQVSQFFNPDGSLILIPVKQDKKIAVLKVIASNLERGVQYPERDLNGVISNFHSDTAAIRRHTIEFGILDRNKESLYWLV